jgi:hypothetical protein
VTAASLFINGALLRRTCKKKKLGKGLLPPKSTLYRRIDN